MTFTFKLSKRLSHSRAETARFLVAMLLLTGCTDKVGTEPSDQIPPDTSTINSVVASVTLTPGSASGSVGQSAQFSAIAKDGAGRILTGRTVTWSSGDTTVVTVSAAGYATAVGGGSTTVNAKIGSVVGHAAVTVTGTTPNTVASVTVTPGSASGAVGESAQFTAVVKDAAGTTLTGQVVTWSSTDPAVVSVSSTGYGTAVGAGTAAIVATAGGRSGQAAITVTGSTPPPGTPATISITPGIVSDSIGATAQLTALVKDAAGTVLSGQAISWNSSAPGVASVGPTGMVTSLASGSATITASTGSATGSATISVTGGSTPPPANGSEPVFQTGQTLIWKDTFDGILSDAALLANYSVLNGAFIHADAVAGLTSSGAARIDWPAETGCQDDSRVLERGIAPVQEIYVTYSVRYTAGFQFDWRNSSGCTGNAKKLFFLYAVSGSRFDFISENHWLGMGSDYDHPLFAQNVNAAVSDEQLGDGNWHRITIHVRQSSTPSTPDGLIEGWIDGVQRWSHPNIASNASGGWNYFRLPATFNQGSPVTQAEWVDDLTVWRP